MVNAIIIDDERHNIFMLQSLLKENCPDIHIISTSSNVDDAYEKITSLKPDLIFLDIKMRGKSGFDLLRLFTEITFEVIFVSSYNDYAITAFEFNALGYILKPIDYLALQKTVNKTISIIKARQTVNNPEMTEFIKALGDTGEKINKVSAHHNGKVYMLNVADFVYIESKTDYCEINLIDSKRFTTSKGLKQFESLLSEIGSFIRINKSIIVNTNYIVSYTKGETCEITLKTGQVFEVSRRKKTSIISSFREKLF